MLCPSAEAGSSDIYPFHRYLFRGGKIIRIVQTVVCLREDSRGHQRETLSHICSPSGSSGSLLKKSASLVLASITQFPLVLREVFSNSLLTYH